MDSQNNSHNYNRKVFTGLKMETQSGSGQVDFNPDNIFTATSTENPRLYIDVYDDHIGPSVVIPQLYDLTLMYGAGKEPTTVDQFYTDHPELKVSPLGFIDLKNLEISNKNIKRLRYATITKNLFDMNIGLELENDCKVSYSGNTISFTSLGGTATPRFMFNKITVEIGKTYTVSANWEQTDNSHALGLFISNENSADHSAYGVIDKTTRSRTFTATSTDLYLKGYVDYSKRISTVTISNLQIEEGSTATPYVPYGYLDLGIIPSNSVIH